MSANGCSDVRDERRPLRIVHCFRSPVGGIFRHVRDLAVHHSEAGHKVGIVCDSRTGGAHEDALFDEIRPHLALGLTRLPIRRAISPSDLAAAKKSFHQIKQLQPDVLHGHGAKGGAYARIVGSLLRASGSRVARFYSPHGGSLHFSASHPSGRLFFTLERLMEHATDGIVFVSDYERETYAAKVGEPRSAHSTIHNGLGDGEFVPVEPAADAADFLYIGMMRDLKGPDVFIRAFAEAERLIGRPLSAHMVGDGDDKPRYQAMIDRTGLGKRIIMHDAMKARKAFAMARHVVIPSRAESMPYTVLEAVAAGKPVLASNVGGIPEMLGRDSDALLPPGDVQTLAKAMARTMIEPGWAESLMPEREVFRARFSAAAMAAGIAAAYREALADAKPIGNPAVSSLS
jgi:glycosyltransferase involved in cell wall biosynthesis